MYRSFMCSALFLLLLGTSSCGLYRMPEEDEIRAVPTTNNPAVTGHNPNSMGPLPGISY